MKKLELLFENEQGKTVTYSLDSPLDPVDEAAVNTAMDEVIAQNIFSSSGGNIITKKGARIVERIVTEVDIGIE